MVWARWPTVPSVDSDNLDKFITIAISGLSLAVSVYVLWRQRRAEGRAHFTAEWEDIDSLLYINHGPGAAKNVRVRFESRAAPVDETIRYIGAFQVMRLGHIVSILGEAPTREILLSWTDNRRKRQEVTLHLPDPPRAPSRPTPSPRDGLEKTVRDLARDEASKEFTDQVRSAARRSPRRRF